MNRNGENGTLKKVSSWRVFSKQSPMSLITYETLSGILVLGNYRALFSGILILPSLFLLSLRKGLQPTKLWRVSAILLNIKTRCWVAAPSLYDWTSQRLGLWRRHVQKYFRKHPSEVILHRVFKKSINHAW